MKNDLEIGADDRRIAATGLAKVLAETFHLHLKTHGYHWNVEGPMFRTYRLLFEEQYRELWDALDAIAERIRALAHYAPSAPAELARLSAVESDAGVPHPREMLRKLIADHETVVRTMRSIKPAIDDIGDDASASLLDERLAGHEKAIWMLRSLARDLGDQPTVVPSVIGHFGPAIDDVLAGRPVRVSAWNGLDANTEVSFRRTNPRCW